MKSVVLHIHTYLLLYVGIAIHVLFYVSALWTGWLDVFFSGSSTHYADPGIDFFQVVRGAWSWWHGGSLTGVALPSGQVYAPALHYAVNKNVYSPLFTIVLGTVLMLLAPQDSYAAWILIKLLLDLLLISFFWKQVRGYKYGQLATFILLASLDEYAELAAGQYHLVFNACLLLFLMMQKRSQLGIILFYAASILVKPVGLLFVPALVFKRHWRLALFALALVVLATWPFLLNKSGMYYINNLVKEFFHPDSPGPDQIMTLNALLRYSFRWPNTAYQAIQYAALALVLLLSASKRTPLATSIFFSIAYFLLFYNLVYEYDWSTLAYVLAICVVFCPAFQTRTARICILLTCLPSCFLLLRLFHVDVSFNNHLGFHPGLVAWRWMVVSKIVPLLLLCGSVLAGDVVFFRKSRRLFCAPRKSGQPTAAECVCWPGENAASRVPTARTWLSHLARR